MDAGGGDANGFCFPYDVIVDILRRLPMRPLAGCRRVCRAWHAIVDAHGLLPPHYFPAFPGIFVNKVGCHSDSAFFSPRSRADGRVFRHPVFRRPVFRHSLATVIHSCNGLLLFKDCRDYYVCNPATVRCSAPLPSPPVPPTRRAGAMFLAFDPAVSRHYEVFFFQEEVPPRVPEPPTWVDLEQPYLPRLFGEEQLSEEQFGLPSESDELEEKSLTSPTTSDMPVEESSSARPKHGELEQLQVEEPKAKVVPFTVYSSRTGQWENREFTPGRCAPGHLYDAVTTLPGDYDYEETVWSSEYWRESLYMHCHNSVLMVVRPSKGTYDLVELPGEPCGAKGFYSLPTKLVLASYEKGIHYVAIKGLQLQVWMLADSTDGQLGWTPSHEVNLTPHCHMVDPLTIQPRVTWGPVRSGENKLVNLFKDSKRGEIICREENNTEYENYDTVEEEDDEEEELGSIGASEHSWNSDENNFIDVAEGAAHLGPPAWGGRCEIMGFHPHKRALILILMHAVVLYHLDTSRMQYLGDYYDLTRDSMQQACCAYGSFPYRPCYVDALPAWKSSLSSS